MSDATGDYGPMPQTDGGADFSLVVIGDMGKPSCIDHGAMNKVTPSPPGFWRCLTAPGCRDGCMEIVQIEGASDAE